MSRDTGIANRLRAAGVAVVEVDGWQSRGSTDFDPRGSVNHHTAGPSSGATPSLNTCINGRPDLAGPLCNVFQSRESGRPDRAYVVAAGRANHAGEGGWRGLTGNRTVYGLEIEHTGTAALPQSRIDTAAAIQAAMFTGDVANVCQHYEWTTRKIDAATNVPGGDFRNRVTAARSGGGAPTPAPAGGRGRPMMLITQKSTGNMWLMESGGQSDAPTFGRRTLIPPNEKDGWLMTGLPHAGVSDGLFGLLMHERERIQ